MIRSASAAGVRGLWVWTSLTLRSEVSDGTTVLFGQKRHRRMTVVLLRREFSASGIANRIVKSQTLLGHLYGFGRVAEDFCSASLSISARPGRWRQIQSLFRSERKYAVLPIAGVLPFACAPAPAERMTCPWVSQRMRIE